MQDLKKFLPVIVVLVLAVGGYLAYSLLLGGPEEDLGIDLPPRPAQQADEEAPSLLDPEPAETPEVNADQIGTLGDPFTPTGALAQSIANEVLTPADPSVIPVEPEPTPEPEEAPAPAAPAEPAPVEPAPADPAPQPADQ